MAEAAFGGEPPHGTTAPPAAGGPANTTGRGGRGEAEGACGSRATRRHDRRPGDDGPDDHHGRGGDPRGDPGGQARAGVVRQGSAYEARDAPGPAGLAHQVLEPGALGRLVLEMLDVLEVLDVFGVLVSQVLDVLRVLDVLGGLGRSGRVVFEVPEVFEVLQVMHVR